MQYLSFLISHFMFCHVYEPSDTDSNEDNKDNMSESLSL